ncbi:MAG: GWxTD domain-containing protein [bacterium]|nr:GWxTD domain-containing protein [bacterium]
MIPILLYLFNIDNIEFRFSTGSFLNETKSPELRIFYEINRDELVYIKSNKIFIARLQISCTLTQNDKEIGDVWVVEDSLYTYEATILKSIIKRELNMSVAPGKYKLKLEIKDLNSQRVGKKIESIVLKDLSTYYPQSISSIRFIDGKACLFEVYNFSGSPFELSYWIGKFNNSVKFDQPKFINPVRIEIPVDSLEYGTQKVIISVGSIEVSDSFYIQEPFWVKDYEKRIEELTYIAKPDEIDSLLAAPISERERCWKEFWKKRDPSPETERNEFEDEYFKRVDYANENFSCARKGWKTDRGRVYIKLGPPDEVDSHPFEISQKPYEVWRYYLKKLEFIFVDEHGFGDYILVYPKYWDEKINIKQ